MGILDFLRNAGPSEEEIRKTKGRNLFGFCPFCGGEVEAHQNLSQGIQIRCTDCLGHWIRSGTLTGQYECLEGPEEFEGEVKHRKAWKAMKAPNP